MTERTGRRGFGMPNISDRINSIPVDPPTPGDYLKVPVDDIEVMPQVREVFDQEKLNALKAVIQRDGQRQPVECYYEDGRYVLLTGERRYRAVKALDKQMVDVRIRKKPEPIDAIYLQISENEDREPLTRIELAKAISALCDAGEKIKDIAKQLGIGDKQVPRYRAIGNASERVHALYDKGVMDIRSLELMAKIEAAWPDAFDEVARSVVDRMVGRSELESIYSRLKGGEAVSAVVAAPAAESSPARDDADPVGSQGDATAVEAGLQATEAAQQAPEAPAGLNGADPQEKASAAQEGGSAGDDQGGASSAKEGAGVNGASQAREKPPQQDKSGISVDHHYEATHLRAPEGIIIEVKGKLDNGVPIRGTLMMDRVDEVSDYVWVRPDDQESNPVKLEAKRLKILSVTGP